MSDTPGDSTVKCKAKKSKPEKKQTVEPKITVVNAAVWFHGTIETNLDEVGAIKLKAEKRDDNLGYSGAGNLTADNTQVKFFSDKKCKKPIDPAAGPVAYKFGTLCSEVTIYYKGALAGATGLTLTLEPADDARITVQGPATGSVQAKLANVVTPKLELEHKLVLFNRKLDAKQGSGEGKILPSATYIEASATQTDATSPFTKTGKLSFAPANVEVFTDAACTKPFNRDLTAAELLGAQPFKLWLRGKKAGKFKAKLTLADPATPSVRRETNPTPEQEMGVVELLLKLHQHDISALKGSSMQVDPDTDPDTKYHSDLLAKKLPDQKLMTDAEKIGVPKTGDAEKPGRLLHAQANAAVGRARLVIGKIKAEHLPADTDDYDIVLNVGRGVAPGGTKPEELQGDPADVPATGAIAVCDAEFDGATVAAPSFKVSLLKAAEKIFWVEGTTPTDTPCDVRLDIGFDRPAGGLAKTVKRNGDWARFTVVQIKEIKLDYKPTGGSPVQWNAARNEFYINMKSDPDGRKITIQAELTKKLKNVPLYFMLAPDKDNRKDAGWGHAMPTTWKWKDIAQKFKHKDKDKPKNFLHLSEKTDADGKAKKEGLLLSRFGGDRFMPACYVEQDPHLAKYVEGNVGLEKRKPSMAADKIAVSRMFWYQLIEVTGVANPGVAGAVGQYEMVKARMEQAASKVVNPAPAGSLDLLRKSAAYFDHQFVAPGQSVGLFRMA